MQEDEREALEKEGLKGKRFEGEGFQMEGLEGMELERESAKVLFSQRPFLRVNEPIQKGARSARGQKLKIYKFYYARMELKKFNLRLQSNFCLQMYFSFYIGALISYK